MKIIPTKKINSIREWIAWRLVDLSKWIYPNNEAASSFLMERLMEAQLEAIKYGTSELEVRLVKRK